MLKQELRTNTITTPSTELNTNISTLAARWGLRGQTNMTATPAVSHLLVGHI